MPVDRELEKLCARDDATRRPLPRSALVDELGAAATAMELASLNELCADVWCEGSFQFYFHHLACDAKSNVCHLDMRLYTHLPITPAADMTKLSVSRAAFRGRVVGQAAVRRCVVPCTPDAQELDPPCGVFDVRCEIDVMVHRPTLEWFKEVSACIKAVETGIRAKVAGFSPR